MHRLWIAIVFVFACGASFVIGHAWQQQPAANRGSLKLLLGHTQLGVDTLAMGERSYPPNYASPEHTHESLEVLYVLEGLVPARDQRPDPGARTGHGGLCQTRRQSPAQDGTCVCQAPDHLGARRRGRETRRGLHAAAALKPTSCGHGARDG